MSTWQDDTNKWFLQDDVQHWVSELPQAKFIPVYQRTYSLLEHETLRLLGVRRPSLDGALDATEYNTVVRNSDLGFHKKSGGQVYCADRISTRLFKRANSQARVDGWYDTATEQYLTKDESVEACGRSHRVIWIRRDILIEDLALKHRLGIITLSSFRFSERSLEEMSLSESRIVERGTNFILSRVFSENVTGHFRMRSLSLVEGKAVFVT